MNLIKVNNRFHSETQPAVKGKSAELWFLNGRLHRYRKPAVIDKYTQLYFWRGIFLEKKMADGSMKPDEILNIRNMEQRRAVMEITGYEQFLKHATLLDKFTPEQFIEKYPIDKNPMYRLYTLKERNTEPVNEENAEPVNILVMLDPSKEPIVTYAIRVNPQDKNCKSAVARSYGVDWQTFYAKKNWV